MSRHILDATGLLCPMPVIKTQQKISSLEEGDELEVLFTDPGASHDISAWVRVHRHSIINISDSDYNKSIVIVVRGEDAL